MNGQKNLYHHSSLPKDSNKIEKILFFSFFSYLSPMKVPQIFSRLSSFFLNFYFDTFSGIRSFLMAALAHRISRGKKRSKVEGEKYFFPILFQRWKDI